MEVLKHYYKESRKTLFGVCLGVWLGLLIACFFFNNMITEILLKFAEQKEVAVILEHGDFFGYLLSLVVEFCSPTGITVAIYYLFFNYINKKLWKKKFPQFDISGTWIDKSHYTRKLDGTGWEGLDNVVVPAPVTIEQTCESVRVKMSVGEDFKWYSMLADWNDKNELEIFYRVDYFEKLREEKNYPEFRIGYECMSVCTENVDAGNRPRRMKGKFWHCISNDGKPMYMGDVTYERE